MIVYVIMGGLCFDCATDDAGIEAIYTSKKKAEKARENMKKENKYRDYWIEEWETRK